MPREALFSGVDTNGSPVAAGVLWLNAAAAASGQETDARRGRDEARRKAEENSLAVFTSCDYLFLI
jgi:hypothetical protein